MSGAITLLPLYASLLGQGKLYLFLYDPTRFMGYAMVQLVEALRYKSEGREFDGVTETVHGHNPSGHTMALGSTQPLTKMSKDKE
jgi:hypothetical protein